MKNLAKSAGLLFIALGALCVTSCDPKDDLTIEKAKGEVTGKSSVSLDLKAQSDATGKTVNRGTLHAWISEVDVTVKSNDFNYAPFMVPFTLTDLAAGTAIAGGTVDGTYNLENVALGSNDFTVVTKSITPSIISFESTTMTPIDRMNMLKTKNPYAIYGASILGFNVVAGANTIPQTMLMTQHGRACGVFTLSQTLKDLGVTAKVTLASNINIPVTTPVVVSNGTNASFYWSHVNATAGKSAAFAVELRNANGVVYKTLSVNPMTIAASSSLNNIYTINDSGITCNTALETFTAQPWLNDDNNVIIE